MRYERIPSPIALLNTSVRRTSVFRRVKQFVSAEGLEYYPLNGGRQQKSLPLKGRLLVSAEGLEPSTNGLKGRYFVKKPSKSTKIAS
ncbi:MAG: hypothetical protein R6W69_16495 [Anaerolineales bacterium]